MAERGDPIDRTDVYRTLIFAFAVWAAHFIVSYGAVLIFPDSVISRWIAITALFGAVVALTIWWRKIVRTGSPVALGALGLSFTGVLFGTFPAVVG